VGPDLHRGEDLGGVAHGQGRATLAGLSDEEALGAVHHRPQDGLVDRALVVADPVGRDPVARHAQFAVTHRAGVHVHRAAPHPAREAVGCVVVGLGQGEAAPGLGGLGDGERLDRGEGHVTGPGGHDHRRAVAQFPAGAGLGHGEVRLERDPGPQVDGDRLADRRGEAGRGPAALSEAGPSLGPGGDPHRR